MNFLKFIAAKFDLNLSFFKTFSWFKQAKNKNLYKYALKPKIYTVFREISRTCSHKDARSLW